MSSNTKKSWAQMARPSNVPIVTNVTKHVESNYENWKPLFPTIPKKTDECVIQFTLSNQRMLSTLRLGSNCFYELYVRGHFYGDGGMRCSPGKLLRDTFTFAQPIDSHDITVLVHYVSYNNSVWYRMLFSDPFFNDYDEQNSWQAGKHKGIKFAAKISSQLMRQNIVQTNHTVEAMQLLPVATTRGSPNELGTSWNYIDPAIKFNYPVQRFESITNSSTFKPFNTLRKFPQFAQKSCSSKYTSNLIDDLSKFTAKEDENLMEVLHNIIDRNAGYYTIDLKQNGLYKLFVEAVNGANIIVFYSEVADFEVAWDTDNHNKVWLADLFNPSQNESVHGIEWRGCRYLHVLASKSTDFKISAIRKEYCFEWIKHVCATPELQTIYDACKRNLIACVDGGIVDTCWRERAQWVGDAYISTKILRKMCSKESSIPIIRNVLFQIADSYDPTVGMVQGAYPIKKQGKVNFLMPTYHLLWILSVIEHQDIVPELIPMAIDSLRFWETKYVSELDNLVTSSPGWNFVDWAGLDASGRGFDGQPNCFVNVLYMYVCNTLDLRTVVSKRSIDGAFLIPDLNQYSLYKTTDPSLQATSIAIAFMETSDACKEAFLGFMQTRHFINSHTMYYGYYVAKALTRTRSKDVHKYIVNKYLPCATTYSTIIEKIDPESSMAHGWSIGVAELL